MEIYPTEIVSDAKGNVLRVLLSNGETWLLKGKCLRCGKCGNPDCQYWEYEMLNGKRVVKCNAQLHGIKPWACQTYPRNPLAQLDEGCGYYWEKI